MRTRRIRIAAVAALVLVLLVVGILTGALRQYDDEHLAQVRPGESFETSLVHVDVERMGADEDTILAFVTATAITDHPVPVGDVFAFRVDGEQERFSDAEVGEVRISHLNPRVPVDLVLSYSPSDGEDEIELLILDGQWQTQNENALALPDHAVLIHPVAVVVE